MKHNPANPLEPRPPAREGREVYQKSSLSEPSNLPPVYSKLPGSFLKKVVFTTSGCWIWLGASGFHPRYRRHRYGQIRVWLGNGKSYLTSAHRRAYELANEVSIPDDMDVDHLCRNKLCVNPDHLQLLSHWENCKKRTGAR